MQEIARPAADHGQWATLLQIILSQMTKFAIHSVLMSELFMDLIIVPSAHTILEFLVTRLQKNYAATMTVW
jgi:hypothetical protein